MRWREGALLAAVAMTTLAIAACSQPTAPWSTVVWETASVAGGGTGPAPLDSASRAPTVTVNGGTVEVRGRIASADLCGRVHMDARTVTQVMRVVAEVRTPSGVGCFATINAHEFTATARHAPGSYRLRVEHRYADCCWQNRIVLDTIITVP